MRGGVFTAEACVVGKIWLDCNENQIQDPEEVGVPGVRLYFEDGTYLISDWKANTPTAVSSPSRMC